MTQRIDDRSRDPYIPDLDALVPSTRPETPLARQSRHLDDDFDIGPSHERPQLLAQFVANARPAASATIAGGDPVKAKQDAIDKVASDFSGPYTVEGRTIRAPVMFRMAASNPAEVASHAKELAAACAQFQPALSPDGIRSGQASPAQVVAVTQALVDAGKLPPGPGDLASRIRTMQWQYGVGIDCASFTRQAFVEANHCSMQSVGLDPQSEAFRGLDANPNFTKVGIAAVRPGDVITLDPQPGYRWGHNVIVHGNEIVSQADRAKVEQDWKGPAKTFFLGPGPFRAIEVDSSWGAGALGSMHGGYRRDTWYYDEATKLWGYVDPGDEKQGIARSFVTTPDGPAGDLYHGAYRVRGR